MAQSKRVSGVATTVAVTRRRGTGVPGVPLEWNNVEVRYHNTLVAQRDGDIIRLNSGGWLTATTKLRMNQFANQFCDGKFKVYQHKGEWYVQNDSTHETQPFEDGMQFALKGVV